MSGRYKILDHLGAGGVGEVYKAYDTQLDRYVAIKRLLSKEEAELSDQTTSILKKEAASLATMQHPNIVSIYDLASDDDGLFIVMELLDGDTLADWLERGPLGMADFKEFATQCLEGILSAHQMNILHRDLKPENIKMSRLPGGRLQAKIVDFGLARMSYAARKQSEDQSGNVQGSIYYMAPEQFLRRPLDGRTDLYSLGCVFYQSLSGQRPFQGDTVQEVMDAHLNHHVYDLKELCPQLAAPVCDWVMWMINTDQIYRPANAQAALDHLRALEDAGWFDLESAASGYAAPAGAQASHAPGRGTGRVRPATGSQVPTRTTAQTARPVYRPPGAGTARLQDQPGYAGTPAPKPKSLAWLYVIIALAAVLGGGWVLWSKSLGPKPSPIVKDGSQQATSSGLSIEPKGLLAEGWIAHYRAGEDTEAWYDIGQPPKDAQPGDLVVYWHDLQPKAGDAVLSVYDRKKDYCPKYGFAKPEGFKESVGILQFDFGDGMESRMDKKKPEAREYPFAAGSKNKGLTLALLGAGSRISDKEVRIIQFSNQDGLGELALRAYPNNEIHCIARTRGKDGKDNIKEGKVSGVNTKWFNLISVSWSDPSHHITMSVRAQDGTRKRAEMDAPRDCPVLNEIHISAPSKTPAPPPEDRFVGDIVELAVWPFPMDWEPRSQQDQRLAEFYLSNPGRPYD